MFYGVLTTLPLVVAGGQPIDFSALLTLESGLKLAYLALVGSALCYILWNRAIQEIGVLNASLYIYVVPLVTLLMSAAILNERITAMGLAGIVLVIAGMVFATVQEKYIKQVE
jgi:drug/metabolite transporter (DMT)-like permease